MLRGTNQLRVIIGSIAAIFIASAFFSVPIARAVEMDALHIVEVPIDPLDGDARVKAYSRAVTEVLIRVTGMESGPEFEDILSLFPNPAQYVLQFRQPDIDNLVITLDGEAMERLLRQAGHPVWGSERPMTLIWLAVDWGGGEREIIAADADDPTLGATRSIDRNRLLRERVQAVAKRRGVPVVFPLLDTEDREALSFSELWGGFDEPVIEASRRYGTTSVLVGRIRAMELIRDRWTFYFGGQAQPWVGSAELAVNQMADVIAAQFAYRGNAAVETVGLFISDIDNLFAYRAVQRFVQDISFVEDFTIETVSATEMLLRVRVQGGRDRLASALEFSGMLKRSEVNADPGASGTSSTDNLLEFVYWPYVRDAAQETFNTPDVESDSPR